MYKPQRGNSAGSGGWKGGKKFGEKKPWERGSDGRNSVRSFMHNAMCDACGKACQVPFVPNGNKPVLCSFCFHKDEQGQPQKFGNRQAGTDNVQAQLLTMNAKLDTILRMLKSEG